MSCFQWAGGEKCAISLQAYVAHRALHLPQLYRAVHKWHHAYKQPTAFSALGQ